MADVLTIAVDAMGGDRAPDVIVEGVAMARARFSCARFLLFGDEARLAPLIAAHEGLGEVCEIRHGTESISSAERPSQALRHGQNSTMALAIKAVKNGEAAVAVSAGNTGAMMALAKFILRTLPGIDRPALASRVPTAHGESVMLDLGANVECDENNLFQFAIMGAAFARAILGLERPRIGLLNIGVEELKGNEAVKGAGQNLSKTPLPLEFIGFIEGDGIAAGDADVIVADGFTGNVAIKTAEGMARLMHDLLGRAFATSLLTRFGYALTRRALKTELRLFDAEGQNGAVFLGLNGLVVKSHGGADGRGFFAAMELAMEMAADDLCGTISANIEKIADAGKDAAQAAAS